MPPGPRMAVYKGKILDYLNFIPKRDVNYDNKECFVLEIVKVYPPRLKSWRVYRDRDLDPSVHPSATLWGIHLTRNSSSSPQIEI